VGRHRPPELHIKLKNIGDYDVLGEIGRGTSLDLIIGEARARPEQAIGDGRGVDARTDVYALGATLFESLTLSPPA